ncbi:MAG: 50S ribosomal protein L25 [Phycisphaerales bacterium]|nr:50S ribosomal protein L25 [Phycisphaerales bacterium]
MSHDTPVLEAITRERTGTRYAQRLRNEGRLPAVVYGHQIDPISVHVDAKETLGHLRHGAHVVTLRVDGAKDETCLIRDLQFGYLGDNVIHIDFSRVNLTEVVEVNVQLVFTGEPAGAKLPGAIVSHDQADIEVRCKVNAIPDEIRVDLTALVDQFTASQIELPAGLELVTDPDTVIARIDFVHEEAEGEETEVAGGAEPEVIGRDEAEDKGDDA